MTCTSVYSLTNKMTRTGESVDAAQASSGPSESDDKRIPSDSEVGRSVLFETPLFPGRDAERTATEPLYTY